MHVQFLGGEAKRKNAPKNRKKNLKNSIRTLAIRQHHAGPQEGIFSKRSRCIVHLLLWATKCERVFLELCKGSLNQLWPLPQQHQQQTVQIKEKPNEMDEEERENNNKNANNGENGDEKKNKFQMVFFARLMSTESTKHKFSLFSLIYFLFTAFFFFLFCVLREKKQKENRRTRKNSSVCIPLTRCDLPFFRWVFCHSVRLFHCCRGSPVWLIFQCGEQNLENKCVRYNQLQLSDTN